MNALAKITESTIWDEAFPCRGCNNANVCKQSEIDCKAFRMYTNTGTWANKDVGKLLRTVNWEDE